MQTLEELIDLIDPAWPIVHDWLSAATNQFEILKAEPQSADNELLNLQITTRSPLGAIAHSTGGILFDHGWLRLLGSGNERFRRTLVSWNRIGQLPDLPRLPGAMLVADDAIGGFFAVNGGAFEAPLGDVQYFSPDTLCWQNLGIGYSSFVQWACLGDLEGFYQCSRWDGWEREIAAMPADSGMSIYPFLWTAGSSVDERSRRRVPIEELWELQMDLREQIECQSSESSE